MRTPSVEAPLRENDVLQILRDHGRVAAPADGEAFLRVLVFEPAAGSAAVIRHPPPPRVPWTIAVAELRDGLARGALLLRPDDPLIGAAPAEADLSDLDRRIREERWRKLGPAMEGPDGVLAALTAGRPIHGAVAARAAELGIDRKHLYDLAVTYLVGGQCVAALAGKMRNCGAPGRARLPGLARLGRPPKGGWDASDIGCSATREMRDTIMREAPALRRAGHSWEAVQGEIVRKHYSVPTSEGGLLYRAPAPGVPIPTTAQVVYYGRKAVTPAETLRATAGRGRYMREHRGRPGTLANGAAGPGAVYVVDATVLNVWLRGRRPEHRHKVIGRAVLYLVFDLYSHLCVGFHVALRAPSWQVALRALFCAMTPKQALITGLKLPFVAEEWPCFHRPGELLSDRGPEWTGNMVEHAAQGLGIKRSLLEPYRPDLNGLAESGHKRLKDEAAAYAPGVWQRPERGVRQNIEALYDLDEMRKAVASWVRHHNVAHELRREHAPPGLSLMPDGLRPTPVDAFNHGLAHCGRPQIVEEGLVLKHLLPRARATVSDRGFKINGLRYVAQGLVDDPRHCRGTGMAPRSADAAYDPEDANVAYLVHGRGAFERLVLAPGDEHFAGWSYDEVEHDLALGTIADRRGSLRRLASGSRRQAELRQIEAEALQKSPERATWGGREEARIRRRLDALGAVPDGATPRAAPPPRDPPPRPVTAPAAPAEPQAPTNRPLRPSYAADIAAAREAELPKRR